MYCFIQCLWIKFFDKMDIRYDIIFLYFSITNIYKTRFFGKVIDFTNFFQSCVKTAWNYTFSLNFFSKLKLSMFLNCSSKTLKIFARWNPSSPGDDATKRRPCRGTAKSLNNSERLNESDVTSLAWRGKGKG